MNKSILKNNFSKIALAFLFTFSVTACSEKVVSPEVQKLQSQQELLDLNSKLNKLNLSLEKELEIVKNLSVDVEKANEKANDSANDAKKAAAKLAKNPGDTKLASKADKASKKATNHAKKAVKLNKKLSDANDEVKDYQKDIKDTEAKLSELKSKIDYVPNK
jgi:uncharacterized coiled-coil DUF342 family protein